MSKELRYKQKLKASIGNATKSIEIPAFLGDLAGNVQADNKGNVYAVMFSGEVITVYNQTVPLVPRLPVILGYDKSNPKVLQVLRSRNVYATTPYIDIPNHATNHRFGGIDPDYVQGQRIIPGLAFPQNGLTIQFLGYVYWLEGWLLLDNQEIDLTSEIPASGANYVLVEVDDSQTISLTAGGSVASRELLEYSDIPSPSTGMKPLFAVKVYLGQTEFIYNNEDTDIIDLRWSGYASGGLSDEIDWTEITNKPTTFAGADSLGVPYVHVDGALAVATDVSNAILITNTTRITAWYIHCKNTGSASSTIVDINKNGVTIFTTQANRPTLAFNDANGWVVSGLPDFIDFVEGDVITFDVDQIATGAADLFITPLASVTGGTSVVDGEQGFMINGKIVTSVSGNNLTVAIKTLAGNDPSGSDPVYVRVGDTRRAITAALSVTKAAGTNWFNSGSANLATFEIDYFVYVGYNSTDGIVIGFSRIPYARTYGDFSTTSTNDRYAAISTITNAASTDVYELVGRFNATLSASASYNWSIPGTSIIVSRPIFETRWLLYAPAPTGFSAVPTNTNYFYKIIGDDTILEFGENTNGTSNATTFSYTLPISSAGITNKSWSTFFRAVNNGAVLTSPAFGRVNASAPTVLDLFTTPGGAAWTNANGKRVAEMRFQYQLKSG